MTSEPVYLFTGLLMCAVDPLVREWRDTGEGGGTLSCVLMRSAPCGE